MLARQVQLRDVARCCKIVQDAAGRGGSRRSDEAAGAPPLHVQPVDSHPAMKERLRLVVNLWLYEAGTDTGPGRVEVGVVVVGINQALLARPCSSCRTEAPQRESQNQSYIPINHLFALRTNYNHQHRQP